MKVFIAGLFILLFVSSCINSSERGRAIEAVEKFMSGKHPHYQSEYFSEFYEQNYSDLIEKELGTNEKIRYSIIHTYYMDEEKITDEYFHLDKNFRVLGQMPKDKMVKITENLVFSSPGMIQLIDSLNNVSRDSLTE